VERSALDRFMDSLEEAVEALRVGEGLREAAWADDGTVEALEDPEKRFAVGVLWHPEAGDDLKLFEALVAEAGAYREQK
jgi:gamma-glutamyl-gamma-aminobutyrate hydrolase PuuD